MYYLYWHLNMAGGPNKELTAAYLYVYIRYLFKSCLLVTLKERGGGCSDVTRLREIGLSFLARKMTRNSC
jgi:hypothetical protein